MSRSGGPTRTQSDLADMVEMLLDKGVVINADIAVSVGETELLGIEIRAALASFETAAKYGLEFPTGTDMERVDRAASGDESIDFEGDRGEEEENEGDSDDEAGAPAATEGPDHPTRRPHVIPEEDEGDENGED